MARAGVGKTACLVQLGLDYLTRGRPILHISLGQAVEHVQSLYDSLFKTWAQTTALSNWKTIYAEQ